MAMAVVTVRLMPEGPEVDLESLKASVLEKIAAFAGEGDTREEVEPIAFGLKALRITFVMDEDKGSPDALEPDITSLEGVGSFEVVDVRRAVG
ncbi:elongation factor 1-beta [Candidatus Woesearchaeota archaeon]|nr:elongation factor 1-beta [Candidatus Woesearchaeota archaeon]